MHLVLPTNRTKCRQKSSSKYADDDKMQRETKKEKESNRKQ